MKKLIYAIVGFEDLTLECYSSEVGRLIQSSGLGLYVVRKMMAAFSCPITKLFRFCIRRVANSVMVADLLFYSYVHS